VLSGRAIDDHAAVVSSSGATFNSADSVNSTVVTTDGLGAKTNQIRYEPFGASSSASTQPEPFWSFTGRIEVITNMLNYRARFYSSILARFITEDPIKNHGVSPYAYVSNAPLSFVDPFGLEATTNNAYEINYSSASTNNNAYEVDYSSASERYRLRAGQAFGGALEAGHIAWLLASGLRNVAANTLWRRGLGASNLARGIERASRFESYLDERNRLYQCSLDPTEPCGRCSGQ
jgi:RHS repeat-associated protein